MSSELGYSITAFIEQYNPLYSFQKDSISHKFKRSLELAYVYSVQTDKIRVFHGRAQGRGPSWTLVTQLDKKV